MNILKENGIFAFICSNKFTKSKYGEKLRKLLLTRQIKIFDDFNGIKVFKEAQVDTCIIQIKKDYPNSHEIFVNQEYYMEQNFLSSEVFSFEKPEILELKQKLIKENTILEDLNIEINYGIKTGLNEAFIINKETKNALISKDSKNKEIIKPVLRGKDVKKRKYKFCRVIFIIYSMEL